MTEDVLIELADETKTFLAERLAPVFERLAVLEAKAAGVRDGQDGLDGKDGLSQPPVDVIDVAVKAAQLIPVPKDGKDGKDADMAEVSALRSEVATLRGLLDAQKAAVVFSPQIEAQDSKAVERVLREEMPQWIKAAMPEEGRVRGLTKRHVTEIVTAEITRAVQAIQPKDGQDGRDGKDADAALVASLQSEVGSLKAWRDAQQAREASVDVKVASAVDLAVKAIPAPQHGKDGRSVDVAEVKAMVAECVTEAVAAIPPPKDGQDGKDAVIDVAEVARLAAALVPVPKDGKDAPAPDLDVIALKAAALVPKPADGKDGDDGRDVDAGMLETIVAAHVERAIFAMPKPADGKSLTTDDVAPLIKAEVAAATADLRPGSDGVGITGALIDQDGNLQLTKSDGSVQVCGRVVGAPGKDADMDLLIKHATRAIEMIPTPKDGEPGKDGQDGLGFDDMDLVIDDEKGFTFRWSKADQVKERPIPLPFDRGVYRPGASYRKSSMVTAQGSLWLALKDTTDKPGDSKAWRLIVKRGRDGKDAPPRDGDV